MEIPNGIECGFERMNQVHARRRALPRPVEDPIASPVKVVTLQFG
jgi:hypothetical protein